MSNKTITEINEEIEVLRKTLKSKIDEFQKANPGLELTIEIEKRSFGYVDGSDVLTYNPKIEVTLK